jgi:hypothetical protein
MTNGRKTKAGARLALPLLLLALGLPDTGCHKTPPAPSSSVIEDSPFRTRRPAVGQVNPSTLLATGVPPLLTVFTSGGPVRIVDADARATLVSTTVPPNSIILLDAQSGIRIGQDRVYATPLHPDHRYEIWWDAKKPPK